VGHNILVTGKILDKSLFATVMVSNLAKL